MVNKQVRVTYVLPVCTNSLEIDFPFILWTYLLQIGFITYVVHPLWETWGDLVSNASKQLYHLEENRDYYQSMYNRCLDEARSDDCALPSPHTPEEPDENQSSQA